MECLQAPFACVRDIENCGAEVVVQTTLKIGSYTMYTDSNNKRADRKSMVASLAEGEEVVLVQFLLYQEKEGLLLEHAVATVTVVAS